MERAQIGRILAAALLVAALVVVVVVLVTGGSGYTVKARFVDAGLLVKGDLVTVGGQSIGKVDDLKLSDDGQAVAKLSIDSGYAPLRRGTRAVIRKLSLSGEASDYVDLQLGPGGAPEIRDGSTISGIDTTSDVALDELINTFDPKTRTAVKGTIRFLGDSTKGQEARANASIRYLDPALSASAQLFGQLDRSRPDFERFITATAGLTTDLSAHDDQLSGLVSNLATTMRALATERVDLGTSVDRLPRFLRRASTTFVNLRSTLDALDPLVRVAKPVVRQRLRPLFRELRGFSSAARPTVADLSQAIRRPGADNDLVELLRAQPAVDQIANRTAERNGKERPGAFPATQAALKGATPQVAYARPYSVDAVGWFDDFSTSGAYDALGSFSRAGLALNQFSFLPTLNTILPIPPGLRGSLDALGLKSGRNNRCPGSLERKASDGSNPYLPSPGFDCDPTQVPIGP